jgi:ABC-type maltose transport system permease subunit
VYIGVALALPFFIANVLVVMQASFFLSLLRPFGQSRGYEQILVLSLIALVGVGGLVALSPILKERRFYAVNAIVGLALVAFAVFAGYGLGMDVYHCDILKIPNCD